MPHLALLIDYSIPLVSTGDTGETFTILLGNDKEDRKCLFMVKQLSHVLVIRHELAVQQRYICLLSVALMEPLQPLHSDRNPI